MTDSQPILLYDGECGVCNRFVSFILRFESGESIRFASQSSHIGQQLLHKFAIPASWDTVVFVERGRALTYSTAAFTVLVYLRLPWRLLRVFRFLPRSVADAGYKIIAENRRMLGNNQACRLIKPEEQDRFLDYSESIGADTLSD